MRVSMIFGLGVLTLWLSLLGSWPAAGSQAAATFGQEPPPTPSPLMHGALPPGSMLLATRSGSFVDNGSTQWVALWTEPDRDLQPLPVHVGVVAPYVEAPWSLFWSASIATSKPSQATLSTFRLGSLDAFAVASSHDDLGSQLLVDRWDGSGFSPLLDQAANNPSGFELVDLDGDGTPEIVRNESSGCLFGGWNGPFVPVVYHWDGAAFAQATRDFPAVVDDTDGFLALLRGDQIFWRNATRNEEACFWAVVAYVAQVRGDLAAEYDACQQAPWFDPDWLTPSDWQVTVC